MYTRRGIFKVVREGRRKDLISYIGTGGFSNRRSQNRGWLLLREAVRFNQLKTVRFLLNYKAPVNNPHNKKASSPLHLGVKKNNEKIVRLLVACKANANAKNKRGITPLNIALRKGYHNIFNLLFMKACKYSERGELLLEVIRGNKCKLVSYLLKHGAPANYISKKYNSTPLQCAVKSQCWKVVKILLNNGVDVNETDKKGKTILFYAIQYKKTKLIPEILKRGINVNKFDNYGESPIRLALKSDFDQYIEMLMQYGADIYAHDNDKTTLLFEAVSDLRPNSVKLLLKYGTKYNKDQKLYCFCILFDIYMRRNKNQILPCHIKKYKQTLEILLDHGVSTVDYVNSFTMLTGEKIKLIVNTALVLGSHKLVENFVLGGGVINWSDFEEYPLIAACRINKTKLAEIFLKAGADVNYRPAGGTFAITYAIKSTNYALTQLLLNEKSNYSMADLFYYAVVTGSCDLLKFLFSMEPNFNTDCIDPEKGSLANVAAWWGRESVLRIILDRDVSLTTRDAYGDTPLHYACIGTHRDCIKLILQHSLDTNQRNIHGFTPLQYFRRKYNYVLMHIVTNVLIEHIIKLYYADLYVNDEDKKIVLKDFHSSSDYVNEVESLKNTKIGKSSISYYDILRNSVDCLAKCMRNKNVIADYNSFHSLSKFPIYSDFLNTKYRLAQKRKKWLEIGSEAFRFNFSFDVMLPQEIIDKILCYLSNAELRYFSGHTSGAKVVCFKDIRPYKTREKERARIF